MKDISEKHVMLSGLRIAITNASELDGTIFRFGTSEQDALIRGQSLSLDDLATFHNPVFDPSLQTGDKEDLFQVKLMKPGKIQVRSIHHYNRESRKSQQFGHRDIGYLGRGHIDKCWDIAVMVQKSMQLDPALSGTKLGPGKKSKAEIHYG